MSERENLLRAVRQKHDAHHDSQNRNPPGLIRTVAHEIPPEPFSFVEWLTPGNTQRAGRALCLQERGTLRLLNGKASTFQPSFASFSAAIRLCGHVRPPQYTTIFPSSGKFVHAYLVPHLVQGRAPQPGNVSSLNHSSVTTFQNWKEQPLLEATEPPG